MERIIKKTPAQFLFDPTIEGGTVPTDYEAYIVLGMGGSHLAADLLRMSHPEKSVLVWNDYGLPPVTRALRKKTLVVASSYSGNTEEVIDGLKRAIEEKLPAIAISTGGKLLEVAKTKKIPYITLPDPTIQPRSALGYSFRALLKVLGDNDALAETKKLSKSLDVTVSEEEGRQLAERLRGLIPIIYASNKNEALAYNWKIKFNETGKIPAFANVLPELNHNEMTGFDKSGGNFFFVLLKDNNDNPRILKRMDVLKGLYEKRGFEVRVLELQGSPLRKMFSSFLTANWTAYYLALKYGFEPEAVPMVEEFKKLIK